MNTLGALTVLSLSAANAHAEEPTNPAQAFHECLEEKGLIEAEKSAIAFKLLGFMYTIDVDEGRIVVHLPKLSHTDVCGEPNGMEDYPYRALFDANLDGNLDGYIPKKGRVRILEPNESEPEAQELYADILEKATTYCEALSTTETVTDDTLQALKQTVRFEAQFMSSLETATCSGSVYLTRRGLQIHSAGHCFPEDSYNISMLWIAEHDGRNVTQVYRTPNVDVLCREHDGLTDYAVVDIPSEFDSYLEPQETHFSGLVGNPFGSAWSHGPLGTYERKRIRACDEDPENLITHTGLLDDLMFGGISGGPLFVNGQVEGTLIAGSPSGNAIAYPTDEFPRCRKHSDFSDTALQLERCDVQTGVSFIDGQGNVHSSIHIIEDTCEEVELLTE